MKDNEILVLGVLALIVVAYAVSKKAAIPAATAPATAANPTSQSGAVNNSTSTAGQVISGVDAFASWLNGPSNNSGSTNSTSGTNQSGVTLDTLGSIFNV